MEAETVCEGVGKRVGEVDGGGDKMGGWVGGWVGKEREVEGWWRKGERKREKMKIGEKRGKWGI